MIALVTVFGCGSVQRVPYTGQTFDLQLLGADHTDTLLRNGMIAVFGVTPIDMKDFAPVLSMGVGYSVNRGHTTRVDIQNQVEGNGRVSIWIFGPDMEEKAPRFYRLTGGKLDVREYEYVQFLVFLFEGISTEPIREMVIRYGLWEKNYRNIRIEEDFEVELR